MNEDAQSNASTDVEDDSEALEIQLPHDEYLTHTIANQIVVASTSTEGRFEAFFEDDGVSGTLYVVDLSLGDEPIVDAVLIYQQMEPQEINVFFAWATPTKVAFVVDDSPQAVIDFVEQRIWSHTNYPEGSNWAKGDKSWSDDALVGFAMADDPA